MHHISVTQLGLAYPQCSHMQETVTNVTTLQTVSPAPADDKG